MAVTASRVACICMTVVLHVATADVRVGILTLWARPRLVIDH